MEIFPSEDRYAGFAYSRGRPLIGHILSSRQQFVVLYSYGDTFFRKLLPGNLCPQIMEPDNCQVPRVSTGKEQDRQSTAKNFQLKRNYMLIFRAENCG